MLYTVKNDKLSLTVSDMGAEMQSLLACDGTEFLWQGDPAYWAGHAYIMFPICGRLTDGKYTYKGREYSMNLHGFARKTQYELYARSDDMLAFRLIQSEKSLECYPFEFELIITYRLKGSSVSIEYTVHNPGSKELIFSVGGHPGFNVPFAKDGTEFTDYYLEFDKPADVRSIVMSPTCYTTREEHPFIMENGVRLALKHELFDNDAIVLDDPCRAVSIKNGKNDRFVRVEYPDMSYLGLWHAPHTEAPYVCIEPWSSVPAYDGEVDDLDTKRSMTRLAPGGEYRNTLNICVK